MKRHSAIVAAAILLAAAIALPSCCGPDVRSARELAGRIMPSHSSEIRFEKVPGTSDGFELVSEKGKVVIRANNAGSMAVGLNYYLKNYCNASVSWYDYNPVVLPEVLPEVTEAVKVNACVEDRFFLNYCTFGYTMPWWQWEQWERFIDWMALNGVNMPLAITGQEAVWQRVWRRFGMTDDQIRAFFTGPAFLPWQRMCNLDRWRGPLPQTWIDSQAELQKKIVKRERALSMRPVLPAFSGHLPVEMETLYPEIKTTRVQRWGGFNEEHRCTFLNSMDPMFDEIQKAFLEEQTAMYGTDHIYGVDLFNEVDPPTWDTDTLAAISAKVYESMASVDPDAVWLQMGWLFFNDKVHWTRDVIGKYLSAVPQGRVKILDYFSERVEIWRLTDAFAGQPFIWCDLGNFGGNTAIDGNPAKVARLIDGSLRDAANMSGIGCTLEGFGVNEVMFEFVLGQAWRKAGSDKLHTLDEWAESTADSHFGARSESFREAWKLMYNDIYRSNASSRATLTNSRPCLHRYASWVYNDSTFYDNSTLRRVLELMLEEKSENDLYKYDITNVARQYAGNVFAEERDAFTACYEKGDEDGAEAHWKVMMDIFDDMDALLACRREFSLEEWLEQARRLGSTKEESDYYELNAREIITTWSCGEGLNDYANRNLAGLMKGYYKVRWEMWKDRMDDPTLHDDMIAFERNWSDNTLGVQKETRGDAYEAASLILDKYGAR